MAVIQRFVDIDGGKTISAGLVTLGSFNERDPSAVYQLRKLRVVPLRAWEQQLSCLLTLPGGIDIGPIDLPMALNVELPVTLTVTCPVAQASNQRVMCIVADLPDSPNLYGATRLVQPGQNAYVPIPAGCIALTAMTAGVLSFKDSAGNVIGTMTSTQLIPRPRLALTVATSAANSAIIFHY